MAQPASHLAGSGFGIGIHRTVAVKGAVHLY